MTQLSTEQFGAVAKMTGFTNAEVKVVANQVAKGANEFELGYFLNVCKTIKLNPFNKEVWCYKDGKGNLIIFTGRDGRLTLAQRRPEFNGIRSSEYCENDDILEIDIPNGKVLHKFDARKPRGKILGAYAFAYRKDGEHTLETADFAVYNKGYSVWKTHPAEMIKKVAEDHTLKKAFGFSGVQSEYDWDVNSAGIAVPRNTVKPEPEETILGMQILEEFESYDGEDKETLRQMCRDKQAANEFTVEFAKSILHSIEEGRGSLND